MKNKAFWIALGVILLIAILWVAIPEIKKLKAGTTGTGGTGSGSTGSSGNSNTPAATKLDENKLLYKGVRGAEVRELQNLLNAAQPGNSLTADGVFGTLTENKLFSLTGQRQIILAKARELYAVYAKNGGTGNLWSQLYGSGSNTSSGNTSGSGLSTTGNWLTDWFIKQFYS